MRPGALVGLIFTKKKFNAISPETCKSAIAPHSSHKFHPVEFLAAPYLQCDAFDSFPSYYVPIESIRGSSIHVYKCVPRSSIHVYSRMRRPYAWLVRPFCLAAGYQFCTHTPMCVILYIYIGIIVDSICFPSTRP